MFLFSVLYCVLFGSVIGIIDKSPPQWSPVYTVKGLLNYPYAELQEPLHIWYDSKANKSRIDHYNGMTKTYELPLYSTFGTLFKIYPKTTEEYLNKMCCWKINGTNNNPVNIVNVLPDMTGYKLISTETMEDAVIEKWQLKFPEGKVFIKKTMWIKYEKSLNMGSDSIPIPVRYEVKSVDHFYIDFSDFDVKDIDPEVFTIDPSMQCTYPDSATFNPLMEFIHPTKDDHVHHEFESFKRKYDKAYVSELEHEKRLNLFRQNLRYINSHNRAGHSFTLAVNQFADKAVNELEYLRKRKLSGPNTGLPFPYSETVIQKEADKLPTEYDWRLHGAVTQVKDQVQCGSCWAFSATGAVEGALFLNNGGTLLRLSQQALIDCSWGYGNNGCDGGSEPAAFEWIKKHGIPTEEEYGGYLEQDGYCHIDNVTVATKIKGFVTVAPYNENALKLAIFKHGPISVAISASHKSFTFYSNGVYYEPKCSMLDLDHAVLAVGYGTLNGQKYWLIKNSWSNWWGNDGFILMSTRDNNCGVLSEPYYVQI